MSNTCKVLKLCTPLYAVSHDDAERMLSLLHRSKFYSKISDPFDFLKFQTHISKLIAKDKKVNIGATPVWENSLAYLSREYVSNKKKAGNTKEGSITAQLTSCLTGLD